MPSQWSNHLISLVGETQGNHSNMHLKKCEDEYVLFLLVLIANNDVV